MTTKDEALRQAAQRVLDAWDFPQGTPEMHRRMRALRVALAEPKATDTSGQRVEGSEDGGRDAQQQDARFIAAQGDPYKLALQNIANDDWPDADLSAEEYAQQVLNNARAAILRPDEYAGKEDGAA